MNAEAEHLFELERFHTTMAASLRASREWLAEEAERTAARDAGRKELQALTAEVAQHRTMAAQEAERFTQARAKADGQQARLNAQEGRLREIEHRLREVAGITSTVPA